MGNNKLLQLIKKMSESPKPDVRFIETKTVKALKDPDCLSIDGLIHRNGTANKSESVPFIEGTPELVALLKEIYGQ